MICDRTTDRFCDRAACGSERVPCRFQTDGKQPNRCQIPWGMMDMVWVGFRDLLGINSSALGDGRDQRMLIHSPRGKRVARLEHSLYRPGSP